MKPCRWFEVDGSWPKRPVPEKWTGIPGLAVDSDDNVWVFTRGNPAVQVFSPAGDYLFGWGSTEGSHYLRIDRDGCIWTTDINSHVVQKHTRDGALLMTLGTEGEPGEDESHFYKPTDVAFASNGDIFVTDGYGNARIVHFTASGTFVKAWGTLGAGATQFSSPHAIVIDSTDRLYIADRNNSRVQIYTMDGELVDSWRDVLVPWGLWISGSDEIWTCGSTPVPWLQDPDRPDGMHGTDPRDHLIMKFNPAGRVLQMFGFARCKEGQEKDGELNVVHGIALDSKGNVYLSDILGKRVQKFTPIG